MTMKLIQRTRCFPTNSCFYLKTRKIDNKSWKKSNVKSCPSLRSILGHTMASRIMMDPNWTNCMIMIRISARYGKTPNYWCSCNGLAVMKTVESKLTISDLKTCSLKKRSPRKCASKPNKSKSLRKRPPNLRKQIKHRKKELRVLHASRSQHWVPNKTQRWNMHC